MIEITGSGIAGYISRSVIEPRTKNPNPTVSAIVLNVIYYNAQLDRLLKKQYVHLHNIFILRNMLH